MTVELFPVFLVLRECCGKHHALPALHKLLTARKSRIPDQANFRGPEERVLHSWVALRR